MHGSTVTQGDPVLITLLGSTSLDSMELSLEPVIKVDSSRKSVAIYLGIINFMAMHIHEPCV